MPFRPLDKQDEKGERGDIRRPETPRTRNKNEHGKTTHDNKPPRPAPILVSWDGTEAAPFRVARPCSLLMRKGAGFYSRPLGSFCSVVVRLLIAAIDRVADDDGIAVD